MLPNGVIQEIDGSMWIKRKNTSLETFMDSKFIRWPNELRWSHKETYDLAPFKDKYKGEPGCYIIGKGPSLDNITPENFLVGLPIFCCNESIHKIESLNLVDYHGIYVVQQDAILKGTCKPKDTQNIIQFVSHSAKGISGNEKARGYLPALLGLNGNSLTVEVCLTLAKHMGLNNCVLYGFDSCMNKNTDYAKVIGYKSSDKRMSPDRFLSHKSKIEKRASILNLKITFLTTTSQETTQPVSYKPALQPHNH